MAASQYERDAAEMMPGGRGPAPKPLSAEHAAKLPELKVLGGHQTFAHDAGMVWTSPTWYVNGKKIDNDRRLLVELLEARGIADDHEKAAQTAVDFVLAWKVRAVLEEPEFWKASEVLSAVPFSAPRYEVLKDPLQHKSTSRCYGREGIVVCRIYYWAVCDYSTPKPLVKNGMLVGPRGMLLGPAPPEGPTEYWKVWTYNYYDVQLSRHGATYDDEFPGHLHLGGRVPPRSESKLITSQDGLKAFQSDDPKVQEMLRGD